MRSTESILSRARAALVAAATLAAVACASAGPGASGGAGGAGGVLRQRTAAPASTTSRASYVITTESQPGTRHLIDIVRERWPALVYGELPRGNTGQATSIDRFGVYDARGVFLGGPDYLQGVRAVDVREIRRLTPIEEYSMLGKRHPAGAVLLTWNFTRR